jgi:hypothetical protein
MKDQFKNLKENGSGSIEIETFKVTYNEEKETDSVAATFGPWSIHGNTENLSQSELNSLNAITTIITELD